MFTPPSLMMKWRKFMLELTALLYALGLVVIDQIIKVLTIKFLAPISTFPIIKDVLHLTYVENRGAAFGIFQNQKWFLIGITGIFLAVLLILLIKKKFSSSKMLVFTIASIIAGGVGNLIDRIFRGFVVDYIDFRIINFAVFNFADCCVVVATFFLFFFLLFMSESKTKIGE